ncbi:MAG TPA: patatin-like phospholipase family protein [Mycobacteriales bacterium]|nr:patatin-like phospholipase family protein [Mycobacteriales bacterium]
MASPQECPERPADTRLAAAFGGGGVFGTAYGLGVAHALIRAGVPLATAPTIGTSAGAWVAACLATDTDLDDLCTAPPLRVPDPTPQLLLDIASRLFGDAMVPHITATAVVLPTMRRVVLSGADYRVADLVAASSSVPGLFRPTMIGTRSYVDGGVRSLVSADLAPSAENLVVIAPIAGPMFGPAGRFMERLLRSELRRWEERTGGVAHLIRPNREIARLAHNPLQLFDRDRARAAYTLAGEQMAKLLVERSELAALGDPSPRAA